VAEGEVDVDIKLNFINDSNDRNNSHVVIFGENVAADADERHVAWKVIQNCEQGDNHPFVFPIKMTVSAVDSCGDDTPQLPASVAPQQEAVYEFQPTIWIGVASEVEEGATMASAIVTSTNTELSLLGIASADIVMTGGGPGQEATALQFNLDNVVMA
jgi:hypothetical protein